jgi:hypothetical protein
LKHLYIQARPHKPAGFFDGTERQSDSHEKLLDFRGRFAVNPGGAMWYS